MASAAFANSSMRFVLKGASLGRLRAPAPVPIEDLAYRVNKAFWIAICDAPFTFNPTPFRGYELHLRTVWISEGSSFLHRDEQQQY